MIEFELEDSMLNITEWWAMSENRKMFTVTVTREDLFLAKVTPSADKALEFLQTWDPGTTFAVELTISTQPGVKWMDGAAYDALNLEMES